MQMTGSWVKRSDTPANVSGAFAAQVLRERFAGNTFMQGLDWRYVTNGLRLTRSDPFVSCRAFCLTPDVSDSGEHEGRFDERNATARVIEREH